MTTILPGVSFTHIFTLNRGVISTHTLNWYVISSHTQQACQLHTHSRGCHFHVHSRGCNSPTHTQQAVIYTHTHTHSTGCHFHTHTLNRSFPHTLNRLLFPHTHSTGVSFPHSTGMSFPHTLNCRHWAHMGIITEWPSPLFLQNQLICWVTHTNNLILDHWGTLYIADSFQ